MTTIKQQIGSLIDAIIAGDDQRVDALSSELVQARASAQVADLLPKQEPVTESLINEDDFVGQFSRALAAAFQVTPDQAARDIEALLQFGDPPDYLVTGYRSSEFVEVEDGEPVIAYGAGSGFMTYLNNLMPGAGDKILALMDNEAGYN
jgi:hypothetical protein